MTDDGSVGQARREEFDFITARIACVGVEARIKQIENEKRSV